MAKKKEEGITLPAAGSWDESMVDSMTAIANLAVARAVARANESFEKFRLDTELRVNAMLHGTPTLSVRINDLPAVKLTTRASVQLPRLIANARLGLNSLLIGPAGCGKTTVAHQLAESMNVQFGSVCLTAGASETWLFGRQTPTGFIEGQFSKIYREGGVFLADEIDAADANLLLSINTALSHPSMLNPMNGETIPKHKNFIMVAAANTNGKGSNHVYTGRSRLDAATLDRFIPITVDYDTDLERELCPNDGIYKMLNNIRRRLRQEQYDEFVSTRAFIACHKQRAAGLSVETIVVSLCSNWGDAAREIAMEEKRQLEKELSRFKGFDDNNREREKFYQEFIFDPNPATSWKPIEWTV